MFGKNTVLKPVWSMRDEDTLAPELKAGTKLWINSIWPTIQGEGPHGGSPAIFIRTQGCNLRCGFCDTEFDTGEVNTLDHIVERVREAMKTCETDLIVLTGGEPLRQQVGPLIWRLADEGWYVQIETAGTVWPPSVMMPDYPGSKNFVPLQISLEALIANGACEIVCSPKTPGVHENIATYCEHYKYIVRMGETGEDGLPNVSTQDCASTVKLYRPHPDNVIPTIWLQPMAEYRQGKDEMVDSPLDTLANMRECARLAMKHGYRVSIQQHKIIGVP